MTSTRLTLPRRCRFTISRKGIWKIGPPALVLLLCVTSAIAADEVSKADAMSWAIEHRQEAFDRLMPRQSMFASNAGVAVSVRAAGFEDRFEFLLDVTEGRSGDVTASVTLPSGAPLVVQLARERLRGASFESALAAVKLSKRSLSNADAKRLLRRLMSHAVPLRPQSGLFLHRERIEVAVIGASDLVANIFDDGDSASPYSQIVRIVNDALTRVGVDEHALLFDPKRYYDQ